MFKFTSLLISSPLPGILDLLYGIVFIFDEVYPLEGFWNRDVKGQLLYFCLFKMSLFLFLER